MLENQLTMDEVRDRLELCRDNPQILDEIYAFGQMLVHQVVDDLQQLDSKAASMAAYAGAIVTLLISSGSWRAQTTASPIKYGMILSGSIAAFAVIQAIRARTLERLNWFSQSDWLRKECLEAKDAFLLKQFRVLTMWDVIGSYRGHHSRKSKLIEEAQWLLAASVVVMAVALLGLLLQFLWGCNFCHVLWLRS